MSGLRGGAFQHGHGSSKSVVLKTRTRRHSDRFQSALSREEVVVTQVIVGEEQDDTVCKEGRPRHPETVKVLISSKMQ